MPYNSWMFGGIGGRGVGSDMIRWVVNKRVMEERERTGGNGCVLWPRERGGLASRIWVDAGVRPL
jgi:hypothetical protein